jgi:aminoglycoside phosphotransferase (APT) family kinase protein
MEPGIDPIAVLATLGIRSPEAVTPVAGGADTAIWRVVAGTATFALRVFRVEQAGTCRREIAAMGAAAAGGISVPAVHAVGAWHERPALLLSWCEGAMLTRHVMSHPESAHGLGVAFGRMQARIHRISPPEAALGSEGGWAGAVQPGSEPLRESLRAVTPRGPSLLHLDYHPSNVLTDGTEITAVLDWANTSGGDPRIDCARTVTLLRLAPGPRGRRFAGILAVRRSLERGWREGYVQEGGCLEEMAPFLAWAGFAMVADLAKRVGLPEHGVTQRRLDRIRRWAMLWQQRAVSTDGS